MVNLLPTYRIRYILVLNPTVCISIFVDWNFIFIIFTTNTRYYYSLPNLNEYCRNGLVQHLVTILK